MAKCRRTLLRGVESTAKKTQMKRTAKELIHVLLVDRRKGEAKRERDKKQGNAAKKAKYVCVCVCVCQVSDSSIMLKLRGSTILLPTTSANHEFCVRPYWALPVAAKERSMGLRRGAACSCAWAQHGAAQGCAWGGGGAPHHRLLASPPDRGAALTGRLSPYAQMPPTHPGSWPFNLNIEHQNTH